MGEGHSEIGCSQILYTCKIWYYDFARGISPTLIDGPAHKVHWRTDASARGPLRKCVRNWKNKSNKLYKKLLSTYIKYFFFF